VAPVEQLRESPKSATLLLLFMSASLTAKHFGLSLGDLIGLILALIEFEKILFGSLEYSSAPKNNDEGVLSLPRPLGGDPSWR
jgi:hypothetical protein